ncbi:hypothetical protein Dsin_009631 [Dipteronia sinensis]|uniref:Protein FAR1-RELATED SEQUENCE n=1 Tax=Dipteronia sinensis TaxID=43782 RepID=A0AAE0EBX5_9ROSI|nr:hypothetical protein Dsin_009631 [Dipteronia sinensis]
MLAFWKVSVSFDFRFCFLFSFWLSSALFWVVGGRKISGAHGDVISSMVGAGIRPKKAYFYLANETCGAENPGFLKRDAKNYLQGKKDEMLEAGDAQSLLNHFRRKQEMLPETHHRLCIWHIAKNDVQYLSSLYGKPEFKKQFNKCFYGCRSEREFQASWNDMINTFKLQDHGWLKMLYELREKWCPIFTMDTFSANVGSNFSFTSMLQGNDQMSHLSQVSNSPGVNQFPN